MRVGLVQGYGGLPFYFNLTTPVGKGYPNANADDVAFVQFCFVIGNAGGAQLPPASAELRKAWSPVKVTGQTDDATLAAISALQAYRRQRFGPRIETDGIISVVPTASAYYSPDSAYDLLVLNLTALLGTASIWPRIDKDPRCTADLGRAVRAALSPQLTA